MLILFFPKNKSWQILFCVRNTWSCMNTRSPLPLRGAGERHRFPSLKSTRPPRHRCKHLVSHERKKPEAMQLPAFSFLGGIYNIS